MSQVETSQAEIVWLFQSRRDSVAIIFMFKSPFSGDLALTSLTHPRCPSLHGCGSPWLWLRSARNSRILRNSRITRNNCYVPCDRSWDLERHLISGKRVEYTLRAFQAPSRSTRVVSAYRHFVSRKRRGLRGAKVDICNQQGPAVRGGSAPGKTSHYAFRVS